MHKRIAEHTLQDLHRQSGCTNDSIVLPGRALDYPLLSTNHRVTRCIHQGFLVLIIDRKHIILNQSVVDRQIRALLVLHYRNIAVDLLVAVVEVHKNIDVVVKNVPCTCQTSIENDNLHFLFFLPKTYFWVKSFVNIDATSRNCRCCNGKDIQRQWVSFFGCLDNGIGIQLLDALGGHDIRL